MHGLHPAVQRHVATTKFKPPFLLVETTVSPRFSRGMKRKHDSAHEKHQKRGHASTPFFPEHTVFEH